MIASSAYGPDRKVAMVAAAALAATHGCKIVVAELAVSAELAVPAEPVATPVEGSAGRAV